jgi:hypothetical protein
MHARRFSARLTVCAIVVLLGAAPAFLRSQDAPIAHNQGESITPAFEGWFKNTDGTFSLSFGYMNRNYSQELDIPVGPDNKIEPGEIDRGQPTHFQTRRQSGVFTIIVPRDFGTNRVTWTIRAPGTGALTVPGYLRPEWEIDALKESTSGNTPPVMRFDATGPGAQGPAGAHTETSVTLPAAATLTVWVSDDGIKRRQSGDGGRGAPPAPAPAAPTGRGPQPRGPQLGVVWYKYRGPGPVRFGSTTPAIEGGKATTTATFTDPGEYILRVLAWDDSGGPGTILAEGFQCCWTNGYVKVSVKPRS